MTNKEMFLNLFCNLKIDWMIFPYSILYQWEKFQCHTFFSSQDIKQNLLLSPYLDS